MVPSPKFGSFGERSLRSPPSRFILYGPCSDSSTLFIEYFSALSYTFIKHTLPMTDPGRVSGSGLRCGGFSSSFHGVRIHSSALNQRSRFSAGAVGGVGRPKQKKGLRPIGSKAPFQVAMFRLNLANAPDPASISPILFPFFKLFSGFFFSCFFFFENFSLFQQAHRAACGDAGCFDESSMEG